MCSTWNSSSFFLSPYFSTKGKAERSIRTTNDVIRTLLLQASLPPSFWAEALYTATYLINIRPTAATKFSVRYATLFGITPPYNDLHVFCCLCYPNTSSTTSNTSSTTSNKLSPRSIKCVFLGYPPRHRGYRCLDLDTRRIIISRHVVFDETTFPYAPPAQPPVSTSSIEATTSLDPSLLVSHPSPAMHAPPPIRPYHLRLIARLVPPPLRRFHRRLIARLVPRARSLPPASLTTLSHLPPQAPPAHHLCSRHLSRHIFIGPAQ